MFVTVHAENANDGAAYLRLADDMEAIPAKMLGPLLLAGVKKWGHLISEGIDAGEIGPLVEIAVDAGQTQV